eukprot:692738-Rhodomonas_salina.1
MGRVSKHNTVGRHPGHRPAIKDVNPVAERPCCAVLLVRSLPSEAEQHVAWNGLDPLSNVAANAGGGSGVRVRADLGPGQGLGIENMDVIEILRCVASSHHQEKLRLDQAGCMVATWLWRSALAFQASFSVKSHTLLLAKPGGFLQIENVNVVEVLPAMSLATVSTKNIELLVVEGRCVVGPRSRTSAGRLGIRPSRNLGF